ncbi:MAG: lysophospholipid acyltransferase family protein [Acidiferrobacterales bacterium]
MGRRLYSTLFWAFVALSSAVLFPVALLLWALTLPFDPRRRLLHFFTCFWASLYTWLNPAWPVTIGGREKIQSDRASVMVANHLSLLDILVLFRTFAHFKWVSKVENFRVPFIGWNMSLNGYIKLKRGDRASVLRMMEACEQALAQGSSVMMFPEGTRSATGRLRPFSPGAFELALRTRSPVQPILIQGTREALPKRGFVLQGRHPIHITVLDPIPPESFEQLSAQELAQHVRTLMAAALGEPDSKRARL